MTDAEAEQMKQVAEAAAAIEAAAEASAQAAEAEAVRAQEAEAVAAAAEAAAAGAAVARTLGAFVRGSGAGAATGGADYMLRDPPRAPRDITDRARRETTRFVYLPGLQQARCRLLS